MLLWIFFWCNWIVYIWKRNRVTVTSVWDVSTRRYEHGSVWKTVQSLLDIT